jgi:DNA polymerase III subunit gamma/tau
VRELRETCKYAPANSQFKIYIIDEVHMLSTAAFNALLKTLEEPPAHVKFMFATTDPEKVLPTILSRCQRFDLRRIPAALITKHLALIAKQEKVKIDEAALYAIARGADGGMRDAESTLDQLISFCGDKIEEADVLSMFGLAAQSQILKLSKAVLAGEIQTALTELNELAQNGKDLGRLLSDLLNHFRNLLIFQVSRGDLNLLEVSEAEVAGAQGTVRAGRTPTPSRASSKFCRCRTSPARRRLQKNHGGSRDAQGHRGAQRRPLDAVLKQLNQLRGGQGWRSVPPGPLPSPERGASCSACAERCSALRSAAAPKSALGST